MFNVVGNYIDYSDQITSEYSLPNNKGSYEWPKQKYDELSTFIMKICHDACCKSGDSELLNTNPDVIVEIHHRILCEGGKDKNDFAVHSDREGPANGPCNSILYYYKIDDDIDDVGLHFYEWIDKEETVIDQDKIIETFTPVSGDVITFGDNIPHCPGEFKTESKTPKVRGVLAIFILHPKKEKEPYSGCISWLPCF